MDALARPCRSFKGAEGEKDWLDALSTCYNVLLSMCKAMASVTPFITEFMFQVCTFIVQTVVHTRALH
jgi:isoleucyl-tRNA synthetase